MAVLETIVLFAILAFCIFVLYIIIKGTKGSSRLGDILPTSGVPIVFAASPRTLGLLTNIDHDAVTDKYALVVKYVGLRPTDKTDYVFSADDFVPNLKTVDIKQSGEAIICWKNLDGSNTVMPSLVTEFVVRERGFRKLLNLYEQKSAELFNAVKSGALAGEREKEVIEHAKALKAIKELTAMQEVKYIKDKAGGMPNLGEMFK